MFITQVKDQKNWHETVGGVAHTRYPLSIHFHCQNAPKVAKFKSRKKVTIINLRKISKTICISSKDSHNISKVSKVSVLGTLYPFTKKPEKMTKFKLKN